MPTARSLRASVFLCLIATLAIAPALRAESEAPSTVPTTAPAVYSTTRPSYDGIGKVYMGREIAQVMGHLGAGWLERGTREEEEAPSKAIALLQLKPDDVVADIGAGTGYFSCRMATKVSKGRVLAEDIEPEMIREIKNNAKQTGVTNVEAVLGTIEDPKLPEAGVDIVLMVDSYHEFDHPREMMLAIVKSLKPGGRVVDIEYRAEDPQVAIKPHHKMSQAQAIKEMKAVGLVHVKTLEDLPQQHMMFFRKPTKEEAAKPTGSIDGTWLPTTAELAEKKFPDEVRKTIKLVIANDQYTATVGNVVDKGMITLDAKASPKQIDITGAEGPNKGKTILAIYELDGDTLRICYDLSGESRPADFKTKAGSQLFLVTYAREQN